MTKEEIYFALTRKHEAYLKARREKIIRNIIISGLIISVVVLAVIAIV